MILIEILILLWFVMEEVVFEVCEELEDWDVEIVVDLYFLG